MAPIGTIIKNGLLFLILSLPLLYFGAVFLLWGYMDITYSMTDTDTGLISDRRGSIPNQEWYATAILEVFIGLMLSIVGTGIIYMKSLSDSVEEGMVEF